MFNPTFFSFTMFSNTIQMLHLKSIDLVVEFKKMYFKLYLSFPSIFYLSLNIIEAVLIISKNVTVKFVLDI